MPSSVRKKKKKSDIQLPELRLPHSLSLSSIKRSAKNAISLMILAVVVSASEYSAILFNELTMLQQQNRAG